MAINSLTIRTSLWFTLLAAGVFLIMGVFIRASVQHHFIEQDRNALVGKLELIQHALQNVRTPTDAPLIHQQLTDALVGHHDMSVHVQAADGTLFFATGYIQIPAVILRAAQPAASASPPVIQSWAAEHGQFRAIAAQIPAALPGTVWTVAIAIDTRHHTDFLAAFEQELLLIGAGGLGLMAGLGWLVTRRGFRPVLEMAQVAEGISAQQLDERLNPATLPVELQSLANAFNGMLDRLGDSLQRLSAFSSDLAHELRTPVNNLMTQTQVCLSKLRNHEEYREVLYSNLEEFERLGRMIGDMLFLAKADHGLVIPGRQLVDIRSEIEALFEFYDALAADKQLVLVIEGEGQVPGDALMLRRAFSNLLSNAIRHADAQSAIQISLESLPHYLMVTVGNRGDTISTEHLPRLFDRFYRADASRQRQDEGVGLGLAITRSIVLAHGGEVDVTSQSRETRFRISLPTTTITRSRAGAAIANNRPEWESGGGEAS